jgi:hypothetical protein
MRAEMGAWLALSILFAAVRHLQVVSRPAAEMVAAAFPGFRSAGDLGGHLDGRRVKEPRHRRKNQSNKVGNTRFPRITK